MRNFAMLLILLVALGGCDLFSLRESEPPTKPAPWNNYSTSWELCLQNLEYCYADGRNAVKYGTIFTSDYRFWFSAQDVNDYSIAASWNGTQEQDMLLNLHSQSDSVTVEFSPLSGHPDDIAATEVKIYRQYELRRYPANGSETENYSGELELHFRKTSGYWYISKWYDYRAYDQPTWGKMKYDFSQ